MKATARYCALCGKCLNSARGKCDTCEPDSGTPVRHGHGASTWLGFGIFVLMLTLGVGWAIKLDPTLLSNPTGTAQSASDSATRERWDAVEKAVQSITPDATVEPYDPAAPNTMRIVLSGSIVRDLGSYDARKLATMARSRMGDRAIVYVKDDTGRTLAKASPWGVE